MNGGNLLKPIEALTKDQLTAYIQAYISNDFPGLVQLLYRLDISEPRLKQTLAAHPDHDAGELIAQMIIERLEEKRKTREAFENKNWGESEEEKW